MSRWILPRVATLTILVSGLLLAASAALNINSTQSSITATFKQSGVPVDAGFKSFSGRIVYNPAKVAAASATLEVLTGSLDMGADEYNDEVRKKSWFDSTTYPKATFTSKSIKPMGPRRFNATGVLRVKGKVQTITVPISVKASTTGSVFDGVFTLSRKAWGIGDPVWEDVLDDAVVVRFHLISSGK